MRCYGDIRRLPSSCPGCGATRILANLDATGERICAGCAGVPARFACVDCASEIDFMGKRCATCLLKQRTLELITRENGTINGQFVPVRDYLLSAGRPVSLAAWVQRSASARIIRDLVNDQIRLEHATLDSSTQRQAAEYTRRLLIETGLLPERDETVVRCERRIRTYIDTLPQPHQQILRPYAEWHIFKGLRRTSRDKPLSQNQASQARRKTETAAHFLSDLTAAGRELARATQTDVDDYCLLHHDSRAHLAAFIGWAARTHRAPRLRVVLAAPVNPAVHISQRDFWAEIDRLETGPHIPTSIRVAGLFVSLFAQPLTRIVTFSADSLSVTDGSVQFRFGLEPITLPPRLATLVLELATQKPKWNREGSPAWLFPSIRAGQPLSPTSLGQKLRDYGFSTKDMRPAAMNNLAGHIPVGPLAELTGNGTQAARRWSELAGRTWSAYIPLRSENSTNTARTE